MWRSKGLFKIKILSKIWEMVLAATIWTIWLVRNEKLFQGKEADLITVISLIKFRTLSWGLALGLILKEKASWWNSNPT